MSNETLNGHNDCRRVESLLDDLVDGQLTAAEQRRVAAHVAACEACGERLASLQHLLRQVDALPRSLEPGSDLWPDIVPRLTARPRRAAGRWPTWLQQAAAAVVFMALGAGLGQLLPRGAAAPPVAGVFGSGSGQAGGDPGADFALAEADFLRAKEALWSAVYSSRDAASPETREVVERNLAVIAAAIRELRAALEADPGNHQLEGLLLAQHRSEIGLLQRLARATEI